MLRLVVLFSAIFSLALVAAERPNVVVIMVDDMGYSDIGCYGGEIKTPNLDALAAGGMRFTQFYNNAKCTTTRATLVTGLYPRNARKELLGTDMVTFGEVLSTVGYHTVLSGKWHLGHSETTHPFHRGFAEVYGLLDGCSNHFDPAMKDPPYKGGKNRYFAHNDQQLTSFPPTFYSSDAFTDHAITQMHNAVGRKQPYFLHITYTAPHYPLHALPEDIAKYANVYNMGWDELRRQRYAKQCGMGLILDPASWVLTEGDGGVGPWTKADQKGEAARMAVYAAMVDRVDQNIGRLVAAMKAAGTLDNTVLLFFSDNGGCSEDPGPKSKGNPGPKDDYVCVGAGWGWASNAPFRKYKSWIHEGGIATPMIAHWPKHIPAGSFNRDVAHIIDVMPTLVELAGATYPSENKGKVIMPMEGISMLPALRGEKRNAGPLGWWWAGNRGYRDGDYKAVYDSRSKQWELFNLLTDRSESKDLAKAEPERLTQLITAWETWAKKTEAVPGKKNSEEKE